MTRGFISDLYSKVGKEVEQIIFDQKNSARILKDANQFESQVYTQYGMDPIELTGIENNTTEVRVHRNVSDGWGGKTDKEVRYINLRLEIKPNSKASVILEHSGNSYSSAPPEISHSKNYLLYDFPIPDSASDDVVKSIVEAEKKKVRQEIDWRNDAISKGNQELKGIIGRSVAARVVELRKQVDETDRISKLI